MSMMNHLKTIKKRENPSESVLRECLKGVFPVITSPFKGDGALDCASLERLVAFIVSSGVHGAVYPAIASEFAALTQEERHTGVEIVARTISGRIAFIVGISDETAELSAVHANRAARVGADAVMLMAPRSAGTEPDSVVAFFEMALGGVSLPAIMQNAPPPLGSALSIDTVREVCRRVPAILYVKEEVVPCGQRITALREGVSGLAGVFGGAGGRFVLDELARGAAGSMPACEVPEIHAALYRAYKSGQTDDARRLFSALLPLLNLGSAYRTPITKHILVQRGIIANARHRDTNPVLDDFDIAELEAVWSELSRQTSSEFELAK